MTRWQLFSALAVVAVGAGLARAQDDTTQPSSSSSAGANQQQPVPAYGQENAPPPISENPPITGLDQPGLEPHAAPLSYLQPGATISESASTNIGNTLGGGQNFYSVTRALGTLTLERLWRNYDLALDYIGGGGYFNAKGLGGKLIQQMDLDQKITWKRGQLSLRDSFSYLPEGNFGGAYGSLGSFGIGSLGSLPSTGFQTGESLGALGETPRIFNGSAIDVVQELSPKSAITAMGGYAFTHFYGVDVETGDNFLNSSEASGFVGYDRSLTSHTQVAVAFGMQGFDFSLIKTRIETKVAQVFYGHRISGKMDFVAAAGPEFIHLDFPITVCSNPLLPPALCALGGGTLATEGFVSNRLGVAGRAQLRYRFTKTTADLSYARIVTSGSGLFAGAQSDVVRVGLARQLSRVWGAFADVGFSRNSHEAPDGGLLGVPGNVFETGFAGAALHRQLGRSFHAYGSYQFNTLWLDRSYCGTAPECNRVSNRQIITIGVDWTPKPIRLD